MQNQPDRKLAQHLREGIGFVIFALGAALLIV